MQLVKLLFGNINKKVCPNIANPVSHVDMLAPLEHELSFKHITTK